MRTSWKTPILNRLNLILSQTRIGRAGFLSALLVLAGISSPSLARDKDAVFPTVGNYTLTVITSNSVGSIEIVSSTGHGGWTPYANLVAQGTEIQLSLPLHLGSGVSRRTFSGWQIPGLAFIQIFPAPTNVTFNMDGDMVCKANYVNNPEQEAYTNAVTVTFDWQGGTAQGPATATVTNGLAYGTLPVPVRAGYIFGGWWTGVDGTGAAVTSAAQVMATEAQTLYAKWTSNSSPVSDFEYERDYRNNFDSIIITRYIGSEGTAVIPPTIESYPVVTIGRTAFWGCTNLTSVSIPASVTNIEDYAFQGSFNLMAIHVEAGNAAYSSAEGVLFNGSQTELILCPYGKSGNYAIPDGVADIGNNAFSDCGSLTDVTIPGSVTNIGRLAFSRCSGLTSVMIPSNVTSIGYLAFLGCTNVMSLNVNTTNAAFSSLDGVLFNKNQTTLIQCPGGKVGGYTIPNSVTGIVSAAFVFNNRLTAIHATAANPAFSSADGVLFNKGQTTLAHCPGGRSGLYTIRSGVTRIGGMAFSSCIYLTGISIPNSVTSIGNSAFEACTRLAHINIPNNLANIGMSTFGGCSSLRNIDLPNSVTNIDYTAFASCTNLTTVIFGNKVRSIGDWAFRGCSSLRELFFRGTAPSVGQSAFEGVSQATVYYLPGTTGWGSSFAGFPIAPWPNQPPVLTARSPKFDPPAVTEGATVAFSMTAGDGTDPDTLGRGMTNITWYVNGAQKLVTRTGAPNTITSAFTLRTDVNTVQGEAFRDLQIRATALDRQGGVTETGWTLRVNNQQSAQTLTFPSLTVRALGDADFPPCATASSGLTVLYASSNESVALIADGKIRITGTGTAVITATQPGDIDFKAAATVRQTLTVKARLMAEVPAGGGTVTGAGLYTPGVKVALTAKPAAGNTFLHWEDGSQTAARNMLMPKTNLTVTAHFGITTNVPPPVIANPGAQQIMVGVWYELPLAVDSASLPVVTVTGLPAGLSYSAATKTITGVPTAAVTNRTVTVTARNVNRTAATQTFSIRVDPLAKWAQGTFEGYVTSASSGDFAGAIKMSVTPVGGITGSLSFGGKTYRFSESCWETAAPGGSQLRVQAILQAAPRVMDVSLTVEPREARWNGTVLSSAALARVEAQVTERWIDGTYHPSHEGQMWRNVWKEASTVAVVTNYTGYYTATLPGADEYGSGYLTYTADATGGVKTAGKLADGTAVSQSGALILDDAGRVFTVLYAAPAAYQGGYLLGLTEFVKSARRTRVTVRTLDSTPLLWMNLNPQATHEYGAGFGRELGLTGGWYDTGGNLYAYYAGMELRVGTDEGAPTPVMTAGTNRVTAAWWRPDGVTLAVTTNRFGEMTGLSAPRAGLPADPDNDHVWNYSAANTVGLTLALTRATGVFRGTFKAWFDSGATHTSKPISYEGVLTPEREPTEDSVAGRGFFLWADRSTYPSPQGTPVPYSFAWSYDLLLLSQ